MLSLSVSLEDIRAAHSRISPHVRRTPLLPSPDLSTLAASAAGVDGLEFRLKCENLQVTGAFKARGATNRVLALSPDERKRGVITCSSGNHGRALAWACQAQGVPCTVVMPTRSPGNKIEGTREFGARLVFQDDLATIFDRADEIRARENLVFLHSYDDPILIAGQGTVGLEIVDEWPEVETVLTGIGGGGLVSGVATAVKGVKPGARVIGVEPEGAPTMTRALEAGRPVTLDVSGTEIDGLKPPKAGVANLAIARERVDAVVLVPDREVIDTVKLLLDRTKLLVELAGAAAVAALLHGRIPSPGRRVAAVLSGGNVALERLKGWL